MELLREQEHQAVQKVIVLSNTFSKVQIGKTKINRFSQKRNPHRIKKILLSIYLANNQKYKKRNPTAIRALL